MSGRNSENEMGPSPLEIFSGKLLASSLGAVELPTLLERHGAQYQTVVYAMGVIGEARRERANLPTVFGGLMQAASSVEQRTEILAAFKIAADKTKVLNNASRRTR